MGSWTWTCLLGPLFSPPRSLCPPQASPSSWRGTAWSHSLSLTCYCETLTSELQCPHLPNTDLSRNDAKKTWQISGGNMFSDYFLSCERKSRLASPTCSLGELGLFGNQAEVVGPGEVLEKGPQISTVNHRTWPHSPSSSLESKHKVSRKLLMHLLPRRS